MPVALNSEKRMRDIIIRENVFNFAKTANCLGYRIYAF